MDEEVHIDQKYYLPFFFNKNISMNLNSYIIDSFLWWFKFC